MTSLFSHIAFTFKYHSINAHGTWCYSINVPHTMEGHRAAAHTHTWCVVYSYPFTLCTVHCHVAIPPAVSLEGHPTGNTQEVTPAPIPETGMRLATKCVFPQITGSAVLTRLSHWPLTHIHSMLQHHYGNRYWLILTSSLAQLRS